MIKKFQNCQFPVLHQQDLNPPLNLSLKAYLIQVLFLREFCAIVTVMKTGFGVIEANYLNSGRN